MKRILPDLFLTFSKIGLFTFGGGYAMIPLIENICVGKKEWITHEEMTQITVIAESTPGPIAINCATYVGLKKKGFVGAAAATLGVILPSFLIILLISSFMDRFLAVKWVAGAFSGIRIAVGVLITDAAVRMIRRMHKKPLSVVILSASFAAMMLIDVFALHVSVIALMLIAAGIGLAVYCIKRHAQREAVK